MSAAPMPLLLIDRDLGRAAAAARAEMLAFVGADGEPLFDALERTLTMRSRSDHEESVGAVRRWAAFQATADRACGLLLAGASREAQSALLKTFEEPPARTLLVAISADVAEVLPTVRSRSRIRRLPSATAQDLPDLPESLARETLALTDGNLTAARWLADSGEELRALAGADAARDLLVATLARGGDRNDVQCALIVTAARHPRLRSRCRMALRAVARGVKPALALASVLAEAE